MWSEECSNEIFRLTKKFATIDEDMALQLYNYNFVEEHGDDKISDSLLEEMAEFAKNSDMSVEKLVSKNPKSRWAELQRVLGEDKYNEIMKTDTIRGFWGKYFLNVLRGEKTLRQIRKEKHLKTDGEQLVEKILNQKYPHHKNLPEDVVEGIRAEIRRDLFSK
ncbi:hypothetical protein IKW73_00950 [Candidatus Saccharibacteria bacterium]|nr:hypothetical protein [Candidatus Saccharibacteria bacterium]